MSRPRSRLTPEATRIALVALLPPSRVLTDHTGANVSGVGVWAWLAARMGVTPQAVDLALANGASPAWIARAAVAVSEH